MAGLIPKPSWWPDGGIHTLTDLANTVRNATIAGLGSTKGFPYNVQTFSGVPFGILLIIAEGQKIPAPFRLAVSLYPANTAMKDQAVVAETTYADPIDAGTPPAWKGEIDLASGELSGSAMIGSTLDTTKTYLLYVSAIDVVGWILVQAQAVVGGTLYSNGIGSVTTITVPYTPVETGVTLRASLINQAAHPPVVIANQPVTFLLYVPLNPSPGSTTVKIYQGSGKTDNQGVASWTYTGDFVIPTGGLNYQAQVVGTDGTVYYADGVLTTPGDPPLMQINVKGPLA